MPEIFFSKPIRRLKPIERPAEEASKFKGGAHVDIITVETGGALDFFAWGEGGNFAEF